MIFTMPLGIAIKFGKKVRKLRLDQKMSQGKLAKKLAVDPSYISQIERGIGNPSLRVVEKVAKALGVSSDELLK